MVLVSDSRSENAKYESRLPGGFLSQHGYTFPSGFAPGHGDLRLRRCDDLTTDAMYLGPRRRFLGSFARSTVQRLFSCMYKMADFPECSSMSADVLTSRGRISRPDLRRLFPEFGRMSRFFGNKAEYPFLLEPVRISSLLTCFLLIFGPPVLGRI